MKAVWIVFLTVLVALMLSGPVLAAKSHRIELTQKAEVNGVSLNPGTYRIKFNGDNELEIYKGSRLLTKARAEVRPLEDAIPHSVTLKKGQLVEIRLKNEKLVLLGS